MIATIKQGTIDKAKTLGFQISDKLEYRLDTDRDIKDGERVEFYNVIFPPDYPTKNPRAVHDDDGLMALIKQYENRFEDAKRDAEFSKHTIESIDKLRDMFNKGSGK